jgi:hypothetical protein
VSLGVTLALVAIAIGVIAWAALRARSGGVVADPHAAPAPSRSPATASATSAGAGEEAPWEIAALRDHLLSRARNELGVDLSRDRLAVQRLGEAAGAVLAQRARDRVDVNVPFLWADASGPKHLALELEREEIERVLRGG